MADRAKALGSARDAAGSGAKERALDVAATAKERFSLGTAAVRDYIENNPVRALGIALGMGVLLGWLIKRR